MVGFEVLFCTYFKRIERFKYTHETYDEYVAFCVKEGSFVYQIGDEKEQAISEGEIIICPPGQRFSRKIKEPVELCMIKFHFWDTIHNLDTKIKISNLTRFHEDLSKLEECLFCSTLSEEPLFLHYCRDILYLAVDSIRRSNNLSDVKNFIDQNFAQEVCIGKIAQQFGYTLPYLINKFKRFYGVSPKAYLSQVRVRKAKELLLMTDKLSREIAGDLGFSDELYFIRFFKKHTGVTPRKFRVQRL